MSCATANSVRNKIFKGLEGVKESIEYVLTFPHAGRIDNRELHLAATLWCSRMRDMPFGASDDSEGSAHTCIVWRFRTNELAEKARSTGNK